MRLIDADALIDKTDDKYSLGEIGRRERDDIVDALGFAPTIDTVEVVRCKDCIHYESDGGALMVCRIDDMVVDDDDYCSYGEKVKP